MSERKACVFIFLVFLLLSCCLGVVRSEEWYRISGPELSRLETIWTESQADKLNWLSQVKALRTDSATLNLQLKQERERTQDLRKSFEAYEADRLRFEGEQETIIKMLKEKYEKGKAQRNICLLISLCEALMLVLILFFKR